MSSPRYGLSTTALHLMSLEQKFEMVKKAGFDGIEVLVTHDRDSHSYEVLAELAQQYELPVLSIHAPTLLLTHFVWGTNPRTKLQRAAEHAALTGAQTVVVHPPYAWQRDYAGMFLAAVHEVNTTHQVHIAVENMYPWYFGNKTVTAYAPSWAIITGPDGADSLTLDLSHAAVAHLNLVAEAERLANRIRHVHLGGAFVGAKHDTHLFPAEGDLPTRAVFQTLAAHNWQGQVVAEVNTLKSLSVRQQTVALRRIHDEGRELLNTSFKD